MAGVSLTYMITTNVNIEEAKKVKSETNAGYASHQFPTLVKQGNQTTTQTTLILWFKISLVAPLPQWTWNSELSSFFQTCRVADVWHVTVMPYVFLQVWIVLESKATCTFRSGGNAVSVGEVPFTQICESRIFRWKKLHSIPLRVFFLKSAKGTDSNLFSISERKSIGWTKNAL